MTFLTLLLRSERSAAKQRIDGKCLSPNVGPRSAEARAGLDRQETTISSSWTRSASFFFITHTHTYTLTLIMDTRGTMIFKRTRTQETVVSLTLVRSWGDLHPRGEAHPAHCQHLTQHAFDANYSSLSSLRLLSALLPINKVK